MFKAKARPKALSIDASIWEGILLLLEELTWTLVFCNVKIVGNENMPLCLAEFKDLSASNTIVYINLKTTINLVGAAKPMKRPTHLTSKLKKTNCAHMSLSVLIAMVITRQILIYVRSGNIGSTKNGITKSISRFMKTGQNLFAQLWTGSHNNLWCFKAFLSKHSRKQPNCQYYSRDSNVFQYCIHSRTSIVDYIYHSELH